MWREVALRELRGPAGGAVVDDHRLPGTVALGERALDGLADEAQPLRTTMIAETAGRGPSSA
jgi:hypothetical protein